MTNLESDFKFFWETFVTLVVITDPPGVVPVFLGMTSSRPQKERNRLAWQAAVVALGVIVAFALFGRSILAYLGVQLPSLQAAGGLLLLLVALELLTGKAAEPAELEQAQANVAFVPLGTRCSPGREQSWRPCCLCSESARSERRLPSPRPSRPSWRSFGWRCAFPASC